MTTPTKQQILLQIAQIRSMEQGKLSSYSFEERSSNAGPYYKLQHWQNGKNHTRYVSAEHLPLVEEALSGYAKFRELTDQYAQLVIEETRQAMSTHSKKKTSRPKSS
jgi:hypothetical protein